MQKSGEKQMREKDRNSIEIEKMLPQFTTMNVIDGQAGLMSNSSLIFYSLTIDNILNIIGGLLGRDNLSTVISEFFIRWPRNFCAAFFLNILVAGPISRFILKLIQSKSKITADEVL